MNKQKLTVTLIVQVYNGGSYWKECIKSINKYGLNFDKILVSINRGKCYLEDIDSAKELLVGNRLNLVVQTKMLTPMEHLSEIMKLINTDYICFLAHDDLLLQNAINLKKVINKYGQNLNMSILGTFIFFNANGSEFFVKEIYGGNIDKEEFIEYDLAKNFNINISGMCVPTTSIMSNMVFFMKFISGVRTDYLWLTNKQIKNIIQLEQPTVKIRLHDNQQGKIINKKGRIVDNMLYFMYHIVYADNRNLKDKLRIAFINNLIIYKGEFVFGLMFYFKNSLFFISKMRYKNFALENIKFIFHFVKKVFKKIKN